MVAMTPKPENRWTFVMASNSGGDAVEVNFPRLVGRYIGPKM
jgi:hypothetical protein